MTPAKKLYYSMGRLLHSYKAAPYLAGEYDP